jgi:cytochrome P450
MFIPIVVNTDGKEHQRLRAPLKQAFLPGRVKKMEEMIRAVAHRLIDTFCEEGHTDLIANFAGPLPQEVILRMFGIPQADIAQCKRWSDDYLDLTFAALSPQRQVECAHSIVAFNRYMAALAEERSKNPGEDVVSCLLTAHDDETQPLNKAEVVATLTGVLMAGHETTSMLIAATVYRLLSQPERWPHVCMHPQDIPLIIEEALRFDGGGRFYRTALQEVQVGGITIPEGGLLLLSYGSANHDEEHFANAEQFDLRRSPNQHLSFGYGVHFCVGAPLGRLEGRIALEVLSQRFPQLRLQPDQPISYTPNLSGRRLKQLVVAWSDA